MLARAHFKRIVSCMLTTDEGKLFKSTEVLGRNDLEHETVLQKVTLTHAVIPVSRCER